MELLKYSLALFASQWALVYTQQSCYWPDGSGVRPGQGNWVNCHSSQDSVCCFREDVCLASGLCFGSIINMVCALLLFLYNKTSIRVAPYVESVLTSRERYIEADALLKTGVTQQHVRINTVITVRIIPIVYQFFVDIDGRLLLFLFLVQRDTWSNTWLCPGLNNGPIQWWCGNESKTTACRDGVDAYFLNYTKGSVLGFPPVTSFSSAGTNFFTDIVTTTFSAQPTSDSTSVLVSSPSKTSTDSSLPTQTQGRSTSLPTAIGAGVGVPLGIASLGLLGFLIWKQVGRQRTSQSRVLSQGPTLRTGDQPATAAFRGQWTELPDIQIPRELDGTGRKELPN